MVALETLELSDRGRRLSSPKGTPRPKRSVRSSASRFPGWLRLENLYNKCPSPQHRLSFLVLLFTGCRVSEAIKLRRDQVAMNEQAIYVYDAPVLKHKKRTLRTVQIPRDSDNVLVEAFAEYLLSCRTVYLLPRTLSFTGEAVPDEHTSRTTLYRRIREIDDSLFPHLLRGWCAGQLVEEHEFTTFDLMTWFSWKSADTPAFYARTKEKEIERKLGITEAPRLR